MRCGLPVPSRGRDKILKFEGGYHGMSDYGLMSLAPKRVANFPTAVPDSPGIPEAVRHEMLVAPFNDLATVSAMLREHADEIGGRHRRAVPAHPAAGARLPARGCARSPPSSAFR